jgi:tetratricopeptide (TPR) repeat protein
MKPTVWVAPLVSAGVVCLTGLLFAQKPSPSSSVVPTASLERAIDMAAKGRCQEALKTLRKNSVQFPDKQLRYRGEMALVRCAMSLNETETVVQTLLALNRDFPDDPEVLYISTHYYSELANKAAQRIAAVAPSSFQAHKLDAEALESQEKWDEASQEYRAILAQDPNVPGIHYRLARIALSKPQTPESTEEGKRELLAELQIDPFNVPATFFLGEMARQVGQWDEAIARFSRAAELDPGFAEAFLALGMSFNSSERFADAIKPLETYVRMLPSDPAGHYQLSLAYARTGRKEDALHEMSIQQQLAQKKEGDSRTPQAGSTQ